MGTLHPTARSIGAAPAPSQLPACPWPEAGDQSPARTTGAKVPPSVPLSVQEPLCNLLRLHPQLSKEPSSCWAAPWSKQHLAPSVTPKGRAAWRWEGGVALHWVSPHSSSWGGEGARGTSFPHIILPQPVSKGNAAYAMSDARPSRPHGLGNLPAAPSHHPVRMRPMDTGILGSRLGAGKPRVNGSPSPSPSGQSTSVPCKGRR